MDVAKNLTENIDALIIEDEIDICFLLTGILRRRNLESTFVNTISDAQNLLKSKYPLILFIDNNLPDGHGVDFIKQIKESHPLTRIIVITADDSSANKSKALKAGADFFIGKPFSRDTINQTLNTLIAQ